MIQVKSLITTIWRVLLIGSNIGMWQVIRELTSMPHSMPRVPDLQAIIYKRLIELLAALTSLTYKKRCLALALTLKMGLKRTFCNRLMLKIKTTNIGLRSFEDLQTRPWLKKNWMRCQDQVNTMWKTLGTNRKKCISRDSRFSQVSQEGTRRKVTHL